MRTRRPKGSPAVARRTATQGSTTTDVPTGIRGKSSRMSSLLRATQPPAPVRRRAAPVDEDLASQRRVPRRAAARAGALHDLPVLLARDEPGLEAPLGVRAIRVAQAEGEDELGSVGSSCRRRRNPREWPGRLRASWEEWDSGRGRPDRSSGALPGMDEELTPGLSDDESRILDGGGKGLLRRVSRPGGRRVRAAPGDRRSRMQAENTGLYREQNLAATSSPGVTAAAAPREDFKATIRDIFRPAPFRGRPA